MPHALIVEDDPNSLSGLAAILAADGFSVETATTLAEARQALTRFIPDVVLVDLNLPDGRGLDLLQNLPAQPPDGAVPVIVMTGNATVESAIEGLRHGIWDYLLKPVSIPRLRSLLARIPRPYELTEEVQALRTTLRKLGRFGPMVGRSSATQRVFDTIERVSQTEAPVLIHGEAGSGKLTVARALYETGRRKKGPFEVFDCAQTPAERSLESLLFGHERQSFPGADSRMTGALERAAGGVLMLRNITELPDAQQKALVQVLEMRTFRRIGGISDLVADFRIIAATRRDPREAVADGSLREDLYKQLEMVTITLLPLRERPEDIDLLAEHFVEEFNQHYGAHRRLGARCEHELQGYAWPGNAAELRSRLEQAYRLSGDLIETIHIDENGKSSAGGQGSSVEVVVGTPLATVEEMLIRATLDAVGGTRHRAASMLGISPKTLYNKLQRMKMA
jgi:two-component system response regulator HydG